MNKKLSLFVPAIVSLLWLGCKEKFSPNLPSVPQGYLIVEGFINAQGPTKIRLSRSMPLDEPDTLRPEQDANLWIEGEDNTSFTLAQEHNGMYSSGSLPIQLSQRYRLRIRTKEGKEYLSGYSDVKMTPAIDSINWKEDEQGVHIYANTHDPQNQTTYYRYEYVETWALESVYYASYRYENGLIRESRINDPDIFYCWRYDSTHPILLTSSAKLEKDIIHLFPIQNISSADERLGVRYSILARQYALDKEAYQFFEQMKKNTETLGSIFDAQPSSLRGNIRSISDPNEIVIGNVHITTAQEKRLFITREQIRGTKFDLTGLCPTLNIKNHPDTIKKYIPPLFPYAAIFGAGSGPIAYEVAPISCVDCRERGGVNIRPGFW